MLCGSCAGRLAAPWESTAIRSCVLARNYTIFSRHCFRLRPREGFNSEKRAKAYRWTALADVTAKRRTKHRASSIQRERERSWLIAGPTASKTASHNLRHCTTTLPNLWNRSVFQRPDLTKCVGLADGDISALGSKNDRSWTPFSLSLCTLRSFSFRAAIDHDDTIDTHLLLVSKATVYSSFSFFFFVQPSRFSLSAAPCRTRRRKSLGTGTELRKKFPDWKRYSRRRRRRKKRSRL